MTTPRLIGLYSPYPQAGKSTVASYLRSTSLEFHRVSFAEALKRMAEQFLLEVGYSSADAIRLTRVDKEEQVGKFGTARHLMQTLGTEWGRQCVHPNVWVEVWKRKALKHLDRGESVVCDDMRFPNEAQAVRDLGGQLWEVVRPTVARTVAHASEGSLDGHNFDALIVNDGHDLEALHRQVDHFLRCYPTP